MKMFLIRKKYVFWMFIFFCLIYQSLFSQNKTIDSLKNVLLKTKSIEHKVDVLYKLAIQHRLIDTEKSNEYVLELQKVSTKNKYPLGIGYAHFVKSFNLSKTFQYEKAFFEVEKAKEVFKEIGRDDLLLDAICFQVSISTTVNKQDEGCKIALEAVRDPNNQDKFRQLASLYYTLAYYESNYTSNTRKALDFCFLALENYKKTTDIQGLLNTYYAIASIYFDTENFEKAKEYAQFCNESNYKQPNVNVVLEITVHGLLAEVYLGMNDVLNAEKHFRIALQKSEQLKDPNYVGSALVISLKIDRFKKEYDSLTIKANKILSISNFHDNIVNANYYLGVAQLHEKNYPKAKQYFANTISLLDNKEHKKYRFVFQDMALTLKMLSDFKQSLYYSEVFHDLEIKHLKDEKENRINELQTKFEVNEKDIQIRREKLEKQKRELEIQSKNRHLSISILIIITILLLFFILSFFYFVNRKKTQLLEIEKQKVSESLAERELLLKEIHHRVKNNLQIVLSLLNIQATEGRELGIDDFLQKSQCRIVSMSIIHQLLYQNEQLNQIDCQAYLEKLFTHLLSIYSKKSENVRLNLDCNNIKFNLQTAIPLGLILNELFTNSLKHAFELGKEGNVWIEIKTLEENTYCLHFKDDGVGEYHKNMRQNTLGIDLVQQLVKQMKGNLHVDPNAPYEYKISFKQLKTSKID